MVSECDVGADPSVLSIYDVREALYDDLGESLFALSQRSRARR